MSSTRSVLIIGGSGFVGSQLAIRMRDAFKVFVTYNSSPVRIPGVTSVPLNVSNRSWIKRVVGLAQPDVVYYVAGLASSFYTMSKGQVGLDGIHATGPANVLNFAEAFQPRFVFVSSSYVFDGSRGNYRETEIALPTSQLGKAKISGENFIRSRLIHSAIVRSSPVFGRSNGMNLSYLDKLRMKLDRGQTVSLDESEIHSFAPVTGLVDLLSELATAPVKNKTLHYGGLTKLSFCEFGRKFAARFGYDPKLVVPAPPPPKDTPHALDRYDYSLNSSSAVELLKLKPLLLEEGFDLLEKQLVARS